MWIVHLLLGLAVFASLLLLAHAVDIFEQRK
jgi:hypothetical protein